MKKRGTGISMKMDRIKKISPRTMPKMRSMGVLSKIFFMIMSGRLIKGLIIVFWFAWVANDNICTQDVHLGNLVCMAGETAQTKGRVNKAVFVKRVSKNLNDYSVQYSFMVNDKTYTGVSRQKGLVFRTNEPIDVNYAVKDPSCSYAAGAPDENAVATIIICGAALIVALYMIQSGTRRIFNAISVIEYGAITFARVTGIARQTRWGGTLSYKVFMHKWIVTCSYKDFSGKNFRIRVDSYPENYLKKGDRIDVVYDPGIPSSALAVNAIPFFVKTDPGMKAEDTGSAAIE